MKTLLGSIGSNNTKSALYVILYISFLRGMPLFWVIKVAFQMKRDG